MFGEKLESKRVAPRQRVDNLVVVTPEFPEKLPKKIASIIKRVAPFEDMALEVGDDYRAGLDLNDLMEMDGVLDQGLVEDIESGGKMLRAYFRAKESVMLAPRYEEFPGGSRMVMDKAVVAKWDRFRLRVDANMNEILKRISGDRRPIALNHTAEIMQYALLFSLVEQSNKEGFDATIEAHRARTNIPDSQKVLIQCVVAAKLFEKKGETPAYHHSPRAVFELLRDGAYAATPEEGIPLDISGVQWFGRPAHARLKLYSPQNCLILAAVELYSSDPNDLIEQFALSRVTGELVPAGVSLVSAKQVFAAMDNLATYERIRDAALLGMYDALLEGAVQEQPFLSLTEDEQRRVTYRAPRLRGAKMTPEIFPATPILHESPVREPVHTEAVPRAEPSKVSGGSPGGIFIASSIAEQVAEMNRRNETRSREPHIEWSESRITWRRVIRALQRIGVLIEMNGAHPKLKYQNRTTRYLNSHEGDSARNKHELFRVLSELEITKDKFFAALK